MSNLFMSLMICKKFIPVLFLSFYLFVNNLTAVQVTTTCFIANITVSSEPRFTEDINLDWKTDIKDLAYWFILIEDSTAYHPDSVMYYRPDRNNDGKIDYLDTMHELAIFFRIFSDARGYGPLLVHPDSLPAMKPEVLTMADSQLTIIAGIMPEWEQKINSIKRQFGLTDQLPIPINPDLSGNNWNDLVDIALFFIYLSDSLQVLTENYSLFYGLDFNADSRFDFFDVEPFLWRMAYDQYQFEHMVGWHEIFGPPVTGEALPVFSEETANFTLRMLTWLNSISRGKNYNSIGIWRFMPQAAQSLGLPELNDSLIPANMDGDGDRDLKDVVLFFTSYNEEMDLLRNTPDLKYKIDLNFDGKVDSLDIERFLFFLLHANEPENVPYKELPPLSASSKELALDWITRLEPLHPEWVSFTGTSESRSFNGTSKLAALKELISGVPSYPYFCDYNGDGNSDVVDLVTMVLLGREGNPLADRDGNGVFKINDVVLLLTDIRGGRCAVSGNILASLHIAEKSQLSLLDQEEVLKAVEFVRLTGLTHEEDALLLSLFEVEQPKSALADTLILLQNSPNPFNPNTEISYSIPVGESQKVRLVVYDLRGKVVRTLVDGERGQGLYTVYWDGTDFKGRKVSSGVYFYRLKTQHFSATRKMLIVK